MASRREFVGRLSLAALGARLAACAPAVVPAAASAPENAADHAFRVLRDRYFTKVLELNPVVSTYLGGDRYAESLSRTNAMLRDWSPGAIEAELSFLKAARSELSSITASGLSPVHRIDHATVEAQVAYTLHMLEGRRYQLRSVDTYTAEPFRGIDWHMQGMDPGDEREWSLLAERVAAIPRYFEIARANLEAGKGEGILPDFRMTRFDGVEPLAASKSFFRDDLPAQARRLIGGKPFAEGTARKLAQAGEAASAACATFAGFLQTLGAGDTTDRFAAGEDEYRFRLSLLRIERTPEQLFAYGKQRVAEYQERVFEAAAQVAKFEKLPGLVFSTHAEKLASLRTVRDHLEKDSPKNDEELFRWYRETIERAVGFARERGLFDVPKEYRIDVVPTPDVFGGENGGASYYPAPPFKPGGTGRFYLSPTKNDPVALAMESRSSVADTAIHEGFPGHDWNYRVMNRYAREISNVRWLTPGEVEGSFSMWEDSMATEGWALYAEALMAEPVAGRPHGFYTPAEHLNELFGQLFRAARVVVDVGIHTGRMSFNEATDYFLENVGFREGTRAAAAAGDTKAARALRGSEGQIYRYSKTPTQAITYELGKSEIERLRDRAKASLKTRFDLKKFHEEFMRMGSIPPGLFAEELLRRLGVPAPG